jgi:hypothetical protein
MRRSRDPRRAILILGMHRSGTSALARVLGLCGGTLPADILVPNEYNATGYWEPAAVVALHDELLRSAGSSFDDVGVPEPGWLASVATSPFVERLAQALEGAYGKEALWVVKDPRMCRLVPLWKQVLARLDVAPLVVIPVRNPLEVAASLAERDGFPAAKSHLLWLRHFLEAEVATRDLPRSFVSYDALLQNWRRVVRKIGADLELTWSVPLDSVAPQVETFLDPRGRHHVLLEPDPAAHPEVGAWVGAVYEWAVAAAQRRPPATAPIDAVRESLSVADTTFLPLLSQYEHDRTRLEERSIEALHREVEVQSLQATLLRRETEVQDLQAGLAERALRIAALEAALAEPEAGRPADSAHPLFDADWYLERYPDVKASGMDPLVHFLHHGAREGRGPNPLFDPGYYLRQGSDSATANPLIHYLEIGAAEGRDPSPLFDTDWYLRRYPEVAKSGVNPLFHYLRSGATEGRDPSPLFDARFYLDRNPDVAAARANPLVHFLQVGASEGRDPNSFFSTEWYRKQHPDLQESGVNPLVHYQERGAAEGLDPSPLFDTDWYASQNPDAAGQNPLAHYLHVGRQLGRLPRATPHATTSRPRPRPRRS